ncbi:MAG: fibronectin type III domain-containing protein [Ruminococcus sp.]|nr:fibronectin type III domain-containing protein [Ruminococcus sp.]MCM1380876.1 fibronectin type III domain-containing protein [Muribaculaceae bacterium]MCM1479617.1 fibronectin type III domain-containing protein [Muribaculaceae bacterium]
MNMKKIAAVAAAALLAAGICTGVPMSTENTGVSIVAEAAESKLAAPKNVKIKAGSGKVTITWDKVKGADVYGVYQYDAKTKKYKRCKLVESEKAIITGLKNGTTYKFKVAAGKENDDTYSYGTLSAAVSAKPQASGASSSAKEEKPTMKKVTMSTKEMIGMWEYYDFLLNKSYSSGTSYNPQKIQYYGSGFMTNVFVLDEKNVQVTYDQSVNGRYGKSYDIAQFKNNTISNGYSDRKYATYSYGEDKFLFVQFANDAGDHTYIFKYNPNYTAALKKTPVTDTSKLNGKWTTIDFCELNMKYKDVYNPLYPLSNATDLADGYTGVIIEDNEISFLSTGGYPESVKISNGKIFGGEYYVYEINGQMYMYWQLINDVGSDWFYVFKKN